MKIKTICSMIVASFFAPFALAGEPQKPEVTEIIKQAEALKNDKTLKATTFTSDKSKPPNLTRLTRYENAKGELVKIVTEEVRARKDEKRSSMSKNKEEYFFHQGKLILTVKQEYASRTREGKGKQQKSGVYMSYFKDGKCIKATAKSVRIQGDADAREALKKAEVKDESREGQEIYLEIATELKPIKTQEAYMKYRYPEVKETE